MNTDETFTLIFKLDTGSELTFSVNRYIYRSIQEHEWGTLIFQGTRFLKFQSPSGVIES